MHSTVRSSFLSSLLASCAARGAQHHSPTAQPVRCAQALVQLDDLDGAALKLVAPATFLTMRTSPGKRRARSGTRRAHPSSFTGQRQQTHLAKLSGRCKAHRRRETATGQTSAARISTGAMVCASWNFGIEETADKLMELSSKAKENGYEYAMATARNAAAAHQRQPKTR